MTISLTRDGERWTEAEDAELLARRDEPRAAVAAYLERTERSVKEHLCVLTPEERSHENALVEPVQAPVPLTCPRCGKGPPTLYEDSDDQTVACRTDGSTYPGPLDPSDYAAWVAPFRAATPQYPTRARTVSIMTTATNGTDRNRAPTLPERMAADIRAAVPLVGTVTMQAWVRAHETALDALEQAVGGTAIDRRHAAARLLGLPCKGSTYHAYRQVSHQPPRETAPEARTAPELSAPVSDSTLTPQPSSASALAHPPVEIGILRRMDYATFQQLAKRQLDSSRRKRFPHDTEIEALAVGEALAFAHPADQCRAVSRDKRKCPWDSLLRRLNHKAADAGWDWHVTVMHMEIDGQWCLAVAKAPGPGRAVKAMKTKRA